MNVLYSNATQVTAKTPPAIMLLSDDDRAVIPQNSAEYYLALKKAGVKAAIHIYPSGGHGWGYRSNFKYHDSMINDLKDWLKSLW
jgi:dipeptidyl aminopeptidase/acylaminoacyl peptidase